MTTYSHAAFRGTAKGEKGSKQKRRQLHAELLVGQDGEGCKGRLRALEIHCSVDQEVTNSLRRQTQTCRREKSIVWRVVPPAANAQSIQDSYLWELVSGFGVVAEIVAI